ncbi:guanylate kinase [Holospora obtusa F1]|uniref:Guanylate kinase n=1 Tax=Holospora obtusa F1 TaxID=1399147 RepID=W6TIE6_HOLOB|nr:guanylate kinase [Holospora obtusa]ETZ07790.1 guanylate kinase [Holospora obtusa F1]
MPEFQNKSSNGIIFVLSAPSGTGKTSLCKHIANSLDNVCASVSVTTRASRPNEQEGKDYFFVSEADFHMHQAESRFIEWTQVHDHFYATPLDYILECFTKKKDVICALDQMGLKKLKSHSGLKGEVVSIFLVPPNRDALKARLEQRGQDSPEVISRRLLASGFEMEQWIHYDYIVFNDDFFVAASEITTIIRAEKLKNVRQCSRVKKIVEEWRR